MSVDALSFNIEKMLCVMLIHSFPEVMALVLIYLFSNSKRDQKDG